MKTRAESDRTALWDAYRRTTYSAIADNGRIDLHPDQPSPDLDALLGRHGVDRWAYLTAHNPGSSRLADDENVRRQDALVQEVQLRGWTFFEGESVLDPAAWPAEPSLLILGISTDHARSLGRQFGQLAIVVGQRGQPARLVECADSPIAK